MVTKCVHHFCGQCITKAIDSSSGDYCRCPLCNEKITKRSLRPQLEVFDMIVALKEAVDSFESDNQMSLITDSNEMVVFDVSSDKSKSCVQSSDSFDNFNETKDSEKFQNKSLNKTKESSIESSDIESNRKKTISVSDEWSTCDTTDADIKDMDKTEAYFESTKSSKNEESDDSMSSLGDIDCLVEQIPTQSQNLKVTKSRITYSSSRPPTDDRFDRIIRLSEISSNELNERPKRVDIQNDCQINGKETKTNRRQPLTQLNENENKKSFQRKKFKRVEAFDSSDDEFYPIVTKSKDRQTNQSNVSKAEASLSYDDDSEDLFLPAIPNSFEVIIKCFNAIFN